MLRLHYSLTQRLHIFGSQAVTLRNYFFQVADFILKLSAFTFPFLLTLCQLCFDLLTKSFQGINLFHELSGSFT